MLHVEGTLFVVTCVCGTFVEHSLLTLCHFVNCCRLFECYSSWGFLYKSEDDRKLLLLLLLLLRKLLGYEYTQFAHKLKNVMWLNCFWLKVDTLRLHYKYGLFNAVYCEYCTEHNCIVSADYYVLIIIGTAHIGETCQSSVSEGYTSSCLAVWTSYTLGQTRRNRVQYTCIAHDS